MTTDVTVTGLHAYPVKSCRGTDVDAVDLSPQGVAGDRQLLVLREGQFTNQARLARLATVATRRIDAGTIQFSLDSGETLEHRVTSGGATSTIEYYGNRVEVVDQGDALAGFLSAAVGADVRVAGLATAYRRAAPLEEFALVDGLEQDNFVDIGPVLVTNEASLADLNSRLEDPVPMARFRPNIVISGPDAFAEDTIEVLEGDSLRLRRVTHCERCAVTCTDQHTGERSREPLATLKAYRHRENGFAGGVMFGAYMAIEGEGTLRLGDRLRVG